MNQLATDCLMTFKVLNKKKKGMIKMDLENQTVVGTDEVTVNDSLNAALLELTITPTVTTEIPSNNELFIYVDKQPKNNPSEERKQYLFDLNDILRTYNNVSDEFKQRIKILNNDVVLESYVERKISYDSSTEEYSVFDTSEIEKLESYPITLFEGTNYIYTNYSNANIALIYAKDDNLNKMYLNGSMYYHHKLRNDGEFCLDDIYFKDAFTKDYDDLNLSLNNASFDSISSNNNSFSLDEQGNLTVNSISCNSINSVNGNNNLNTSAVCDLIYPVGSIYLSIGSTSPATLFGGSWEKIKDRFLLGAGDIYFLGNTGGESQHTLLQSELPSHTHDVSGNTLSNGAHTHQVRGGANVSSSGKAGLESYASHYSSWRTISSSNSNGNPALSAGEHTHSISLTSSSTGGENAHNNMPPYIAVNIWKRTA